MAEDKRSFVLYSDLIYTVQKMPIDKAGELLMHILMYVNDMNPETDDLIINLTFEPIKQQLKRDLLKWEEKKSMYSIAGKESAKARSLIKPQLYVLRFFNDNEEFLKVGITDNSIGRRYSNEGKGNGKLGYKYDILYQYFDEVGKSQSVKIESEINKVFEKHSYVPQKNFPGHKECYQFSELENIISFIETFNDVEKRSTKSTVNVNVNVNANVNVTDTVKKDMEERKREFYNSLTPFLETYSKELIREFYNYWSEHGEKDKKFRKEKESSFSVERRLNTWKLNESKFSKEKSSGKKESRIDNLMEQHEEMQRKNELKYGTE